ncbi:MAG: DUF6089 family protein [Parafilimonas sp.]
MLVLYKLRALFFCVIIFISYNPVKAQELSVQISPGIMNYGGDLQAAVYTFQNANFSMAANVIYRVKNFSLKGGVTYGKVKGDDLTNTGYKTRNLSFISNIADASLCLQYDLFLMEDNRNFTPYVFAGAGVFHFNPYAIYNSQKVYLQPLGTEGQGLSIYPDKKIYSLTQPEVPFGIGFKYKVSDHVLIGLEFSTRYLFTDYLDDVSGRYPDENELFKQRGQLAVDLSFRANEIDLSLPFPSGQQRGNPKQNDNYYTSTFSFIYVFSKRSGYNAGSSNHNRKAQRIDCPKRVQ